MFKRGIMHFEDYNYEMFNKYVLIDPAKENELDEEEDDENLDSPPREKMLGFSAPPNGEGMGNKDETVKKPPVTDNILE